MLKATLFLNLKDTTGRPVDWSWSAFCDLLREPPPAWRVAERLHLPLLKLGSFENNSRAKGSQLEQITGIEGDHDDGTTAPAAAADMLAKAGVRGVIVTTASHTPLLPRWRAFLPLSRPRVPDTRAALVARLNGVLGAALSPESFVAKQTFFVGRLHDSPHYECHVSEGACIDTLDELDDGAVGKPEHVPDDTPPEQPGWPAML